MSSGIVPSLYKTGFVSPLFKKGSRCEPSNYRPVTLTSHIIKVYERIFRKHMVHYLAVQGPKLWNKVPNTVKTAQSFDSFKISFSKFLALIPDNPTVSGYSCCWSNSLVDYTPTRWSDI